jgi:glycerol-3-phosphate dehydrogenase subunit C
VTTGSVALRPLAFPATVTAVYDPSDTRYYDRADLREEMDRVFDLCQGCRLCFNLCPSFPSLFSFIDGRDGDVKALSDAEHDHVVDECYQCKLCYVKCPYVPPHEWALDFPRLMSRVHANRVREGLPVRDRLTDQFLGRTDLLGRVSVAAAPLVNQATGTPGSLSRKVMEKTVGLAANRLLPPYARQRFTTWFKKRVRRSIPPPSVTAEGPGSAAAIFPTCFIEYMAPNIGQDMVGVFEVNGIDCTLPQGTKCCGAPWLHSGNVDQFEKAARANVAALAREVEAGREIVVTQPTCAYVVKRDYPLYVGGRDAELVAAHTYDPAEYLMARHRAGATLVDQFPGRDSGAVPDQVTYHVACHLQAQNIGLKSRDLLKVAGVRCDLVMRCSGIDGTWGYRAEHYELARRVAQPMADEVRVAGNEVVCGDCHLANGAIEQETGAKPVHPMSLMARAYGIAPETR